MLTYHILLSSLYLSLSGYGDCASWERREVHIRYDIFHTASEVEYHCHPQPRFQFCDVNTLAEQICVCVCVKVALSLCQNPSSSYALPLCTSTKIQIQTHTTLSIKRFSPFLGYTSLNPFLTPSVVTLNRLSFGSTTRRSCATY